MFTLFINLNRDYLAASMAIMNARSATRAADDMQEEMRRLDTTAATNTEEVNPQTNSRTNAPPNNGLTAFLNFININVSPKLNQVQKNLLENLLNLNDEGSVTLTDPQERTLTTALRQPSTPQFAYLIQAFPGVKDFIKRLQEEHGIDDKYVEAFGKLIEKIENNGKITQQDLNDLGLSQPPTEEDMNILKFLFQETVSYLMDETSKMVHDPRKKMVAKAKLALEIANKMINAGERWAHVATLQVQSKQLTGVGQELDRLA